MFHGKTSSTCAALAAVFCLAAGSAAAEPWLSGDHSREFALLIERDGFNRERWEAVPEEEQAELLEEAAVPARERHSQVLASYESLMARWDAAAAREGLEILDEAKLREIRLWLGPDAAARLAAKRSAVASLLSRLASAQPLQPADTAAAAAYLTPDFVSQVTAVADYRAGQSSRPASGRNSFKGAQKIRASAAGGGAALNKLFDGGGPAGENGAPDLSGGRSAAALTRTGRSPVTNTLRPGSVPPAAAKSSKTNSPTPADYNSLSPEARRIYQVHAAVVDANKGQSLGPGAMRGTIGNLAGFDRQECKGPNDRSFWCGYASFIASSAGWYAGKMKKGDVLMPNPGVPTDGIRAERVTLESGEYMRCYDWAGAIARTAETTGISPRFSRSEVVTSGPMGLGEHHYMVFIGEGSIFISDPWKNGAVLMQVPDTPANRRKWARQ